MDERRELVCRALSGRERIAALSREYGVSRKTAHKWVRIGLEDGLRGLEDRSRRPRRLRRIPAEVEARIVELRQSTGYGGLLISELLAADGIPVSHATVDRVIQRQGLGPEKPRKRAATKRFERERPNELWQMDFKSEYRFPDGRVVPFGVLDDHSRYLVGLYGLPGTQLEPTAAALRDCFERCGLPDAILMDHGTPWWSTTNGAGYTKLAVSLMEQDIQLIYGAVGHPQTQGKIERCHQTTDRGVAYLGPHECCADVMAVFEPWRGTYNHRPHSALGRRTPASCYVPSPRRYCSTPPSWEYPEGGYVRRLNSAGILDLGSARYFVCEALAGREVWCREYGHRILVTYRRMYVREIDRNTGRTTPVVVPVEDP